MAETLNTMGQKLVRQLNEIVSGGDQHVTPSPNQFISWCQPGIPMMPEDFEFAAKLGSGKTAEDEKRMLLQAFSWAAMVDFVPDPKAAYGDDQQQAMYRPDGAKRLSSMYEQILKSSLVAHTELTEAQKAKLEKFRKLLWTTKTVTDLVTDEEKSVTEPGPVLKAYNDAFSNYTKAVQQYNLKRVAALAASGPDGKAAVFDWTLNAGIYRQEVANAEDAWVSGGYRNEVQGMNAFINQTTQRDMVLWKAGLQQRFNDAQLSAPIGGQYPYTTLVPANFATSNGWTGYELRHSQVDFNAHQESTSWGGGAGLSFGLFSVGGGVNHTSGESTRNLAVNSFKLSFELAQVLVVRPWFYPELFDNRGWTLRKGEGWFFDEMPSDGARPPKGNFIGYPTIALFARNICIESAEFVSAYKATRSSTDVSASVGWGPFRLSGNYSHREADQHYDATSDGQKLTVPGMQVIGFVNSLVPKSPNPLPGITDFV